MFNKTLEVLFTGFKNEVQMKDPKRIQEQIDKKREKIETLESGISALEKKLKDCCIHKFGSWDYWYTPNGNDYRTKTCKKCGYDETENVGM